MFSPKDASLPHPSGRVAQIFSAARSSNSLNGAPALGAVPLSCGVLFCESSPDGAPDESV